MNKPLALFEGYGVELEYMLVNRNNLNISTICDQVLYALTGEYVNECSLGKIALSNELVMHVLEFKTNGPCSTLQGLAPIFQQQIQAINSLLTQFDAQLLPTGAHPWMNPYTDTKIWPHEYNKIYRSYNQIFDCRGHGWSNLQSTHLNLPFSNDEEFAKLHTAIRLLLPIIPALSASTPILDGKPTGFMDTRLEYYRKNQQKIPSISGKTIPEAVFSQQDYQTKILNKIYQDIAPYDSLNVLQDEWLNSRGAIARFERSAIEIRIIDIQECPQADIAILALIVATLKQLVNENWLSFAEQAAWLEDDLLAIFLSAIKDGQKAIIQNTKYYKAFGLNINQPCTIKQLWQHIFNQLQSELAEFQEPLNLILTQGNLAERIMVRYRNGFELKAIYQDLARCLQNGQMFSN